MRSAEFALQPGQTFDSNLEGDAQPHLTRGDLSFFTNEEGVMCAAIMMRPCKSGRYLHGKHFRLMLRVWCGTCAVKNRA